MVKKGVTKGQVSMEFLIIVGFAFMMLVPLLIFYNSNVKNYSDELSYNQVYKVAKTICDSGYSVYYLGAPARTTIEYYLPQGVQSFNVYPNQALVFNLTSEGGQSTVIAYTCPINMTGFIDSSPGMHRVKVTARSYDIVINETG